MSSRFVVDASVVLGWAFGETETFERAMDVMAALKTRRAVVPAIWQAEVANALVVKERQKRIDEGLLRKLLRQLENLSIEVDTSAATMAFDRVVPLARRHQLSVYGATYLELALREKAPLASFDNALREAARRENVALFEDHSE